MKRNLLIALGVILVALIVLSVFFGARVIFLGLVGLVGLTAIGTWIYMMREVRTRKTDIFPETMKSERAEKRLKTLNILLLVGGITFILGLAGVIAHNAIYAVNETEEAVSFVFGFFGLALFVITTIGSYVLFNSERRRPA
jgi:sterol desaturase/sphingolipid hydroxylase (fatty acid hydroxylase superfamily)